MFQLGGTMGFSYFVNFRLLLMGTVVNTQADMTN